MSRPRSHLLLLVLALSAALLALAPIGSAVAASSGTIVFQGNRDGKRFVYSMNPDGSGVKRLGEGFEPSLSRDGRTIAFVRSVGRGAEIFTMNADGSKVDQVTHDGSTDAEPSLSADGERIVFVGDRRNDQPEGEVAHVFVVDVDGSQQRQLTKGKQIEYEPSFSPNGRKIVFVRGPGETKLMTMSDDGDDQVVLDISGYPFTGPTYPSYSPNGKRILFSGFETTGKHRVYTVDADDGGGLDQVNRGDARGQEPAYSPEGGTIVYRIGTNLLTMSADGQDVTPLSSLDPGEGSNIHPSWGR